jgi:transposase
LEDAPKSHSKIHFVTVWKMHCRSPSVPNLGSQAWPEPVESPAGFHQRLFAGANESGKSYAQITGKVTQHHRVLLSQHLGTIAHLEQTVAAFDTQIEAMLAPFHAAVERLITVPGISATAAHMIIAEIGIDMSRFATAGHLRSWAGPVCVGRDPQQAQLSPRSVHRLCARRGPQKVIIAVAASILTAVYYLLREQSTYRELGARTAQRLARRIRELGYEVEIRKAA